MKKSIKVVVSLILCLAILFSFASCDFISGVIGDQNVTDGGDQNEAGNNNQGEIIEEYIPVADGIQIKHDLVPEGYTGGFTPERNLHYLTGYYWLETYEEVLAAIELLESHGSTITRSIGFDCDGELLDVKWCFRYERRYAEPLEEGGDFFDRKIDGGEFCWFAFYEHCSIDKLVYSYVTLYDCMSISYPPKNRDFKTVENTSELYLSWYGKDLIEGFEEIREGPYYIMYNDIKLANLNYTDTLLPPEYYEEFLSTFVIIE